MTELGDLTRRYFVMAARTGRPARDRARHRRGSLGELAVDARTVRGLAATRRNSCARIWVASALAIEISENDNVPAMDLVPSGVIELLRKSGAQVVSSGDLVTRFYSLLERRRSGFAPPLVRHPGAGCTRHISAHCARDCGR